MQAGEAKTLKWILEFEKEADEYVEPVMHWLGSEDTGSQVRLRFDTKEQAVAFAKGMEWRYRVTLPQTRKFRAKSYANNFGRFSLKC